MLEMVYGVRRAVVLAWTMYTANSPFVRERQERKTEVEQVYRYAAIRACLPCQRLGHFMAAKKWPRQIFHSELSANLGAGLAGLRERHSAQVTVQPINANGRAPFSARQTVREENDSGMLAESSALGSLKLAAE
jgi:hypothetical protein